MKKRSMKAWMVVLALGACAAPQAGWAKAVATEAPPARAQYATAEAYQAALVSAVRSVGAKAPESFVARWFGPTAVARGETPLVLLPTEDGVRHAYFMRSAAGEWVKEGPGARVGPEVETPPIRIIQSRDGRQGAVAAAAVAEPKK